MIPAALKARQDELYEEECDEDAVFPFSDAFEEDSNTFPYGTHSAVSSHAVTLAGPTRRLVELLKVNETNFFVDLG